MLRLLAPEEASLIKVIGTAYKRDDFSTEDFLRYWHDVHAPLSARAPGLRGYVVCEVVRKLSGELEADAFVEQWFDDEVAMEHADASPEVEAAWADVPNYAKLTGTWWVTREHVYVPPPITGPGLLGRQAWIA